MNLSELTKLLKSLFIREMLPPADSSGYTMVVATNDTIDGLIDVESFNEGSVTLRAKGEIVTIPYPDPGGYSETTLKDGSGIIYYTSDPAAAAADID